MTPKEKAKALIDKFYFNGIKDKEYSMQYEDAKQCALLCVDEKIKTLKHIGEVVFISTGNWYKGLLKELEDIKQEIIKL